MKSRRAAAMLVLTSFVACSTTTKYARPPMPSGPEDDCIAACQAKGREAKWDYDCLEACPGVVVSDGECQQADKTANAFCVERTHKTLIESVVVVAVLVTVLFVTIAIRGTAASK